MRPMVLALGRYPSALMPLWNATTASQIGAAQATARNLDVDYRDGAR
jgi:hypothetical protein